MKKVRTGIYLMNYIILHYIIHDQAQASLKITVIDNFSSSSLTI